MYRSTHLTGCEILCKAYFDWYGSYFAADVWAYGLVRPFIAHRGTPVKNSAIEIAERDFAAADLDDHITLTVGTLAPHPRKRDVRTGKFLLVRTSRIGKKESRLPEPRFSRKSGDPPDSQMGARTRRLSMLVLPRLARRGGAKFDNRQILPHSMVLDNRKKANGQQAPSRGTT